jgi:ADP-ribosylglycohydrolase
LSKSKNDIIWWIKEYCEEEKVEPVKKIIKMALENQYNPDVTGKSKGWCLNPIYCAVNTFILNDTFKKGINYAYHYGGDSDTNMCVAGALLGAFYGYDEMYAKEKNNIHTLIECSTDLGDVKRPDQYLAYQIPQRARELYEIFGKNFGG